MTAVVASTGQTGAVQTRQVIAGPAVVVMEPEIELRSRLERILGAGVLSVPTCADVPGVLANYRPSSPLGGPMRGMSGDRTHDRAQGGLGDGKHELCDDMPGGPEFSAVVVAGPSIPPDIAISVLPIMQKVPTAGPRWRIAVVGVAHRCGITSLRNALGVGMSDFLALDSSPDQLRHAVRRAGLELVGSPAVATPVAPAAAGGTAAGGGPIAVFAPKGGAGASTVVVNVAVGLASRSTIASAKQWSYPAAIIDADLQFGDQALMLGLKPRRSLASLTAPTPGLVVRPDPADAVMSGDRPAGTDHKGFVDLVIPHQRSGVGLLASPVDPALADTVPARLVTAAMASIGAETPWLVVDLPSHIGDLTMEVIEHSTHLLVVTATDPPSVKDARIVADTLHRLGVAPHAWTLVCNGVSARRGLSVAQIQQHVGVVSGPVIPEDPAVALSLLRGNPVVLDSPGCGASRAFQKLVDDLIGTEGPVPSVHMATRPSHRLSQLGELGHRVRTAAVASVRRSR